MSRIGLALSGGGFRATLYHLGVIRYLHDRGLLPKLTHITSVSGGSIMAAHLVLNWERYTGTDREFDSAAEELLDFIRLDVRNRVVRRFPFALGWNTIRWVTGQGRLRRLTRPGLLESHYQKHLFGDRCLYELPESPQLHMLATNVNEGCLCSFTRSGILSQHRMRGGGKHFESVPGSLATIAMAVTASSAFPGFFPPIEITAQDVGADESRFSTHLFTDGGVYDNLGVRMFHNLRQSLPTQSGVIKAGDFCDVNKAAADLYAAQSGVVQSALGRLGQLVWADLGDDSHPDFSTLGGMLPSRLSSVLKEHRLYREPAFQNELAKLPNSERMLSAIGKGLSTSDHQWMNRQLAEIAYRDVTGQGLMKADDDGWDSVIVSDAGKGFSVSKKTKGGGLLGTAIRATDILMDRVWELENSNFRSEPDFVFAPMSMIVDASEGADVLHPELQRQVIRTRTDLDRFSELEIGCLVQHGYGVMRKVCRSRPDLFAEDLGRLPPWSPVDLSSEVSEENTRETSELTRQARTLQKSSQRNILGHLLSPRDWPTYVYIPLLILLFGVLPYTAYLTYQRAHHVEMIADAITESNPDFDLVMRLARQKPIPGNWESLEVNEVQELEPSNEDEFQIISDTRIFDLRLWNSDQPSEDNVITSYRRMRVRRNSGEVDMQGRPVESIGHFRIQQFNQSFAYIRTSNQRLNPVFRRQAHTLPTGIEGYIHEVEFDLSSVPEGADFSVDFEASGPGLQGRFDGVSRLNLPVHAPTNVIAMWAIFPSGRPINRLRFMAYSQDNPSLVETFKPTYKMELGDGTLFGWMMVAPKADYVYECQWDFQ